MQSSAERIPVTILTGFLGSGKTTLLNTLLRHPALRDTAVVVNELGEIGLDHLLVAGVEDNVVLLNAGCLCCAVLNTFKETLADLYHRRVRGEVPRFMRVLVETTGLADPAPIVQSLLRDSFLTHYYRLDGVVTTVDAVFGEAALAQHHESQKQVAVADRLVVTKADLTGGACPPALVARLRALNPLATLRSCAFGDALREDVLGGGPWSDSSRTPRADTWLSCHPHDESGDLHRHDESIQADSFIIEGPLSWAGFAGWSDLAREFFRDKMLRCKGILHIAEIDAPVLIQGVQTVFAAPERLAAWPGGDRRSRLVCITHDLDPGLLRASLKALQAQPGTYRSASLQDLIATEHS